MVQCIIDNAEAGCSAEEIAREIYDLDVEAVRRIFDFARLHGQPAMTDDPPTYLELPPEIEAELHAANAKLAESVDGPDGSEIQIWATAHGPLMIYLIPRSSRPDEPDYNVLASFQVFRPLLSDDPARVALAIRNYLSPHRWDSR